MKGKGEGEGEGEGEGGDRQWRQGFKAREEVSIDVLKNYY